MLDAPRKGGYHSKRTKGLMIMALGMHDLAYLARVYDAVKSDNLPEMTTICPECGEQPERDDTLHTTLNTYIPGYWAERGDWGEDDPYGMKYDDAPFILIGCEGYHLIESLSNAR